MLHCPNGMCDRTWTNSKHDRDARAKHGLHTWPFAACVSKVDIVENSGNPPRMVAYVLRRLGGAA